MFKKYYLLGWGEREGREKKKKRTSRRREKTAGGERAFRRRKAGGRWTKATRRKGKTGTWRVS